MYKYANEESIDKKLKDTFREDEYHTKICNIANEINSLCDIHNIFSKSKFEISEKQRFSEFEIDINNLDAINLDIIEYCSGFDKCKKNLYEALEYLELVEFKDKYLKALKKGMVSKVSLSDIVSINDKLIVVNKQIDDTKKHIDELKNDMISMLNDFKLSYIELLNTILAKSGKEISCNQNIKNEILTYFKERKIANLIKNHLDMISIGDLKFAINSNYCEVEFLKKNQDRILKLI